MLCKAYLGQAYRVDYLHRCVGRLGELQGMGFELIWEPTLGHTCRRRCDRRWCDVLGRVSAGGAVAALGGWRHSLSLNFCHVWSPASGAAGGADAAPQAGVGGAAGAAAHVAAHRVRHGGAEGPYATVCAVGPEPRLSGDHAVQDASASQSRP
eukprot:5769304-Pyramimonas_sp.AAC.1